MMSQLPSYILIMTNEVLMWNGKIWMSGLDDRTWLSFNSNTGRITDVGKDDVPNLEAYGKIINLNGCRVFPGFHDSHIHVSSLGESLMTVDLRGCKSIAKLQEQIKLYVNSHPELPWIKGNSWEQDLLGRNPTKEDLDVICRDKPVLLERICHHIWVVNSKALEMAGLMKKSSEIEEGLLEYYPDGHEKSGEPTGIVYETASSILKSICVVTKEEKIARIKKGVDACVKHGLTAVHSNEGQIWKEYCELAKHQQLRIRVFMAVYFNEKNSNNFPTPEEKCGSLLSCDRIKIFVDGALGIHTAALSMPYVNENSNYGWLKYSQKELEDLVQEANQMGFRIEAHVIGDKAAEKLIDALEKAQISPEKRPLFTHCQILRSDLIPRMKKLGAIANIQPQFVTTDSRWLQCLPTELHHWAYPWKSLLDNGIRCAGGSDSPVELPEPMLGIYDAIYRPLGERNPQEQKSYKPEECLSVTEAIDLYTKAGAYATRREHDLGQLLPGFMADLVILEERCDPVEDPKLFASAKVSQVWVAGSKVYENS